MSVSVQQILGFLRAVAPQELALDWDNVGLLVDAGQPVDGVLTTLDITPAVVREAVENDCQLIVSHHPVIFHPLRTLAADDVPALLMKNGISAICMHTNLDAAPGGVNRYTLRHPRHRRRGPRELRRRLRAHRHHDAHHGGGAGQILCRHAAQRRPST